MPSLIQTAEIRPGVVALRFPFNKSLSDAIKTVPGVRWDAASKQWLCPPHSLNGVVRASAGQATVQAPREGLKGPDGPVPTLLPRASELRDYQLEGVRRLLAYRRYILSFDMRVGKGGRPTDRILTPTGWTTYGAVQPGDFVIGSDGKPTRVRAVHQRGEQAYMRLVFGDGTALSVSEDHVWAVQNSNWRARVPEKYVNKTTLELSQDLNYGAASKWFIPMVKPIEFVTSAALPVDPYALGAFLGDAYFGKVIEFTPGDLVVPALVSTRLPPGVTLVAKKSKGSRAVSYMVKGFLPFARQLELAGTRSNTKFIPQQYLFASSAQRLNLLRGLLDTDGHLGDTGIEFSSASEQLANDVAFLVQSLGGTTRRRVKPFPKYTYKGEQRTGKPNYRVFITLPHDVTPTLAWVDDWRPRTKYVPSRAIRTITPDGRDECVCIEVEAKDGLYVTEDFIVTHNTPTAAIAMGTALAHGLINTLVVAYPSSVTGEWRRQLPAWTGLSIGCLEGTGGVGEMAKGLTVQTVAKQPYLVLGISFELLRNEHGLQPTQTVLDLREILALRGTYGLAIDELHYVKNVKAPRTKILTKIAQDPNCHYVVGLTGTPMRNFPGDLFAPLEMVYPGQFGSYSKFTARFANGHMGGYGWVIDGTSNEEELAERLKWVSMRVTRADAKAFLPKSERRTILCAMGKEEKERYDRLEGAVASEVTKALNGSGREDALRALAATTTAAKLPVLVERVRAHALGRGVKVLVGAVFHEGLESAWKACEQAQLPVPMFLAGGWTLPEKRRAIVEQWRQAPQGAVLFVNMLSSGVGIDLSDADVMIGVSLSWVPADFLQFEARTQDVHLGKRTTPPLYEYLLTKGTIDEDMGRRLLKKLAAAEMIIGPDAESAGARDALRESGVIDRATLSLGTTDPEMVQSVIDRMRAKLMGDKVPALADTDENREETFDDDIHDEKDEDDNDE